ncbi:MAG TPA: ATP-binding protein [Solirubrobacteraceae bacterium]
MIVGDSTSTASARLQERYLDALDAYVRTAEESALLDAYELGRQIMDSAGGVLDLSSVHQDATEEVMRRTRAGRPRELAARRCHEFLDEALSPFEMAQRGFREANMRLMTVNTQLAHQSAQLGAVIASINDGLVVADSEGAVTAANERAADLLDVRQDVLLSGDVASVATLLGRRCQGGEDDVKGLRWRLRRRDAEPATIELRLSGPETDLLVELFPVRGENEHGIGVMLRDVTRERELVRAKDELVSIVSHELRGPLSNIIGFADLLLMQHRGNEHATEDATIIAQEGRRLALIIDDFLDLQRIERGAMRTDRRTVELPAILERLSTVVPGDSDRPLAVQAQADVPAVFADPDRILQVLLNLVGNARKYSPEGGEVRVTATAGPSASPEAVTVTVMDQGLGIEAEAMPRLFGEFYRVQTADRQGISGTGLGLSICRKIVRAHQGEIWAESEGPGQGSRFHFTLPVADGVERP